MPHDPDEWLAQLAALPLLEQPGRWWRYGTAFSVLGVLLACAVAAAGPRCCAGGSSTPSG